MALLTHTCVGNGACGYVAAVLSHCRSGLEQSRVLCVQLAVVFANSKLNEAYSIGMRAVEVLDVPFPQPTVSTPHDHESPVWSE